MGYTLEHRWGRRELLLVGTGVSRGQSELSAVLRDASASGAFIRTGLRAPRGASVGVWILAERVLARVVRVTPDGFGVEWEEFAPGPVLAMTRRRSPLEASPAARGYASLRLDLAQGRGLM